MQEPEYTEPLFQAECLNDIFMRHRPPIKNLFPQIFGEFEAKSIVSVTGPSASGKSMFLLELMAQTITSDNSQEIEILLFDIDHQFNIFKFIDVCKKFRGAESEGEDENDYIHKLINRVHVTTIKNQFTTAFQMSELAFKLKENKKISLILFDSLGSFYYEDARKKLAGRAPTSKDGLMLSYLTRLKVMADRFGVSFVYSKPIFMETKRDEITTHQISLAKKSLKMFILQTTRHGETKKLLFTINETGIDILREADSDSEGAVESQSNKSMVDDQ